VSTLRRISASLGLILPVVAALALAAPSAQASTATGKTHHHSSKTHHASSSSHKGKTHHTAQNHTGHKKSTATG
jgi:Ni/Co efflux regulator RcnB